METRTAIARPARRASWRAPPPIGQGLAVIVIVIAVALISGIAIGGYLFSLRVAAARAELVRLDRRTAERRAEVRTLRQDYEIRSRFGELDRWRGPLDLQAMRADQLAGGARDIFRTAEERRQALATAARETRPIDAGPRPGYPQAARERLDDLIGEVAAH